MNEYTLNQMQSQTRQEIYHIKIRTKIIYNIPIMIKDSTIKLQETGCKYALYLKRDGKPAVFEANCERFSSASIIKVPLLLAWAHLERAGEVDRAALCCLDDEPQVRGAGFSWLLRARQLPYQDVLMMMIALSDNLCTNLVIRKIGIERANQVFRDALGLKGTELQRKLMDYDARDKGLDNWISARDCIRFYELIAELTPDEKAWIEPMFRVAGDHLLMRDIPFDTITFHHKIGSIPGVLHDWGYTKDRQLFLLTNDVADEAEMIQIFGKFGHAAVEDLL